MNKMIIAMAMSCGMAICLAKDVTMVTGADLVAGNAKKEYGFSEAQLKTLSKELRGRELTFENGKITSIRKKNDGRVTALISFSAPKSKQGSETPGLFPFHRSFPVNATFSDPAMARLVEKLDEGTKVKQLKGRVHYDEDICLFFELKDATIVVDAQTSGGSAIDLEKMTGADIVAGNAKKERGYSDAQKQALSKALMGRELTFENGKIGSVSKVEDDGSVTATISFDIPDSGLFHPDFTVHAKFTDPSMARFVEKLDEGTKVRQLKGRVHYNKDGFISFKLMDATIVVEKPEFVGATIDLEKMTGADIVAGNAKKERGYSDAQKQALSKALKGRELTFENGKITSIRKKSDGGVTALISFSAPKSQPGLFSFHRSFSVNATFSDPAMARLVEKLDEGTEVRQLTGCVHYDEGLFFELKDATIVVDAQTSGGSAIDLEKMTGADIVAGNAKKKSGYSQAQLRAIAKALKGRELTFENGKIYSVGKDEDDRNVTAMISFAAPESGLFHPDFTVYATFSDPAMAKFVEKLDKGTKVKQLRGRVHYDAGFFPLFELKSAQLKVQ